MKYGQIRYNSWIQGIWNIILVFSFEFCDTDISVQSNSVFLKLYSDQLFFHPVFFLFYTERCTRC